MSMNIPTKICVYEITAYSAYHIHNSYSIRNDLKCSAVEKRAEKSYNTFHKHSEQCGSLDVGYANAFI